MYSPPLSFLKRLILISYCFSILRTNVLIAEVASDFLVSVTARASY